jgi:methylphosphotriester-DNA--protein-cysteine methyltransferase
MKKLTFILILTLGCVMLSYGDEIRLVGSTQSTIYHYETCPSAKNIKAKYKIEFKTPEDAINMGYRPCKICKPPVFSNTKDTDNKEKGLSKNVG